MEKQQCGHVPEGLYVNLDHLEERCSVWSALKQTLLVTASVKHAEPQPSSVSLTCLNLPLDSLLCLKSSNNTLHLEHCVEFSAPAGLIRCFSKCGISLKWLRNCFWMIYSNLIADVAFIYWKKVIPSEFLKFEKNVKSILVARAAALLTVLLT